MRIEEQVPLSRLTTFKAGGAAAVVAHAEREEDVLEAAALAKARGLPLRPLGEGSNVLPSDDGYEGVIVRIELPDIEFREEGDATIAVAGAGVSWDVLVAEAAARGLWGMENLAGIPGTVGAAPVQNIGAYGAELRDTLLEVRAVDVATGERMTIARDECAFGYRDSRFKHEPDLLIASVTFAFPKTGAPRIEYGDLMKARERGEDLSTPKAIGAVVRAIRKGKFPDLAEFGTAGSFFKNPVITEAAYEALSERYGDVPRFPNPKGVKVPLAFILDKALGLRGYRKGNAWLFGAQPLVLVLDPGGKSAEIEALARDVEEKVAAATGIKIEREVRSLP